MERQTNRFHYFLAVLLLLQMFVSNIEGMLDLTKVTPTNGANLDVMTAKDVAQNLHDQLINTAEGDSKCIVFIMFQLVDKCIGPGTMSKMAQIIGKNMEAKLKQHGSNWKRKTLDDNHSDDKSLISALDIERFINDVVKEYHSLQKQQKQQKQKEINPSATIQSESNKDQESLDVFDEWTNHNNSNSACGTMIQLNPTTSALPSTSKPTPTPVSASESASASASASAPVSATRPMTRAATRATTRAAATAAPPVSPPEPTIGTKRHAEDEGPNGKSKRQAPNA